MTISWILHAGGRGRQPLAPSIFPSPRICALQLPVFCVDDAARFGVIRTHTNAIAAEDVRTVVLPLLYRHQVESMSRAYVRARHTPARFWLAANSNWKEQGRPQPKMCHGRPPILAKYCSVSVFLRPSVRSGDPINKSNGRRPTSIWECPGGFTPRFRARERARTCGRSVGRSVPRSSPLVRTYNHRYHFRHGYGVSESEGTTLLRASFNQVHEFTVA